MSSTELREAVVRPATAVGLRVERELTTRIIEEVVDQPGGLPMLSHALLETWRRRRGGVLTLAAYEEAGGVHGAIRAAAEQVYGRLSPAQARTARRLLLGLIAPGEGAPDTRRPISHADLREWPDHDVPVVLERLARARLVTVDEETVELAHEALITGWPRLQGWIEESRERLREHRRLTEAARLWQEHGRDPGVLYRGARLTVADGLFSSGGGQRDDLTGQERAFLTAARVARATEEWTAARTKRRTRRLVVALSVFVAGALTAGLAAWQQNRAANEEHTEATARQVAALADTTRASDPRTAMLLSIAAWRLAPLAESRSALLDALADPEQDAFTDPAQAEDAQEFLTDSGRTLLRVGDGSWSAWDVATHHHTASGQLPDAPVVAVGPDGRTLALRGDTRLWHVSFKDRGGTAHSAPVGRVLDLGADGRSYVVNTSGQHPNVQLRAIADDRVLFETAATGDSHPAPSADGRLVALCRANRPLTLWDTVRHRAVPGAWEGGARIRHCSYGTATIAFSRSGARLAAVSDTGIRVWDTSSGRQLADIAQPGVQRVAFTKDGAFLAAAGQDAITVWRLSAPDTPVFTRPVVGALVTGMAWEPGKPTLRYLEGATVHSLDLSAPLTPLWRGRPLDDEMLSPDGHTLAGAELSGGHYRFQLHDARNGRLVSELPVLAMSAGRDHAGPLVAKNVPPLMAFSPDGRAFTYGVATRTRGSSSSRFVVWDVAHRRERVSLYLGPSTSALLTVAFSRKGQALLVFRATPTGSVTREVWDTVRGVRTAAPEALSGVPAAVAVAGFTGQGSVQPSGPAVRRPFSGASGIGVLALSPNGSRVATGDIYGRVTVWDRTMRHRLDVIPAVSAATHCTTCSPFTPIAFSPDGRTLAVGDGSGVLRLWDIAGQRPLGGSLTTPGDAIRSLAFSPDGGTVYASSGHVPIQRYVITPSQAVTQLCARAGTTLTTTEWHAYIPDMPYRVLCDRSEGESVLAAGPDPMFERLRNPPSGAAHQSGPLAAPTAPLSGAPGTGTASSSPTTDAALPHGDTPHVDRPRPSSGEQRAGASGNGGHASHAGSGRRSRSPR